MRTRRLYVNPAQLHLNILGIQKTQKRTWSIKNANLNSWSAKKAKICSIKQKTYCTIVRYVFGLHPPPPTGTSTGALLAERLLGGFPRAREGFTCPGCRLGPPRVRIRRGGEDVRQAVFSSGLRGVSSTARSRAEGFQGGWCSEAFFFYSVVCLFCCIPFVLWNRPQTES